MIIVSGEIPVRADRIAEAKELARWVMAETAKEKGCITYRFYSDLENPELFRVFEEWESDEALAGHFKAPHMQEFKDKVGALLAGAPRITRYEVANSGPLG